MIYFDSAYVAKLYLNEPGHELVRACAISAGDVATSGRDNRIRVWAVADAKQAREIGFGGKVFRIRTTPDGMSFAGSADKFARQHT